VGPVKSQFGFHLIEKIAHTPEGLQPYEQVQAAIRARLLAERAAGLAEEKALDVAGRVTAEMSDEEIRALAEEEGLEVVTTEPFGLEDTVAGLGAAFNQAAFTLETGAVSEPVRIPRGWAMIKLKEVLPPKSPELAEVEGDVREAVLAERRKEAAVARLRELTAAGKGLDELAGELGLEVQEPAELGRDGTIPDLAGGRDVIDAALGLDAGEVGGPIATGQGAVVFEVVERKKFDPAEFEEEKAATRSAEEGERLQDLKRIIVEKRRRELDTNYNPAVFESFGIDVPQQG
jgi:peptidyl-prolyl cis-trans isomerase D